MDEGLRLAYLAAMDVPVWLLRGSEPLPVEEPPEAVAREMRAPPVPVTAPPGRSALELLGADAAPVARAARPAQERPAPRAPARPAAAEAPSLLLVTAGRLLFIDEALDATADRRATELIGSIALALGGARVAARAQRLDLQALGAAADRAGARDMLLGRLTKLAESESFEHLVLLGQRAAALLLGWDQAHFADRVARVHRVPGLEPGILVTVSCAQMLAEPALKRVAWQELGAARARHDP